MSTSANPPDLADEVRRFVRHLTEVVHGALPGLEDKAFVTRVDSGERHITIRQLPPEGFPVTVERRPLLDLKVSHRCVWNAARTFLSIDECDYRVLPTGVSEPLFRYHYVRDQDGGLPSAHLHVHAHRDEIMGMLLGGADQGRVRERLRRVDQGRFPRLASVHFPLGGPRFRPSLEDVIQMLVVELQIDAQPGWRHALETGRATYRQKQLMAAVADDPRSAAVELAERHGYVVTPPAQHPPTRPGRF